MIILDDQHAELMRIAASQVRARGAYTVVITDNVNLAKGERVCARAPRGDRRLARVQASPMTLWSSPPTAR
jgi:hypothetical protein